MKGLRNNWDLSGIEKIRTEVKRVLVAVTSAAVMIAASCIVLADPPSRFASGGQQPSSGRESTAVPTLAGADLYALCVGISRYKDRSVPGLKWSAKDAKDFAKFLSSQRELYKNINVTLLLDEQATKEEIEKYLFYELRKAGKNDTAFLFLSGHGAVDPKRPGEFFFLSYDANPDFLEISSLNMSGLRFLRELECPRLVLVADACHAGGFSRWRTKAAIIPMKNFIADFSESAGRVIMTSSRPEEYSLEDPRMENSVFTHHFLEALKGAADADGDGVVTLNEAYRYVYDRTRVTTEGAQHPQFEGVVEGVFPLAMTTNLASRPPTSLEILIEPAGADVFVEGRLLGKTNPDGSLYLKYLPLDKPVGVKISKEGWLDEDLGPFVFARDDMHVTVPPLRLKPALASVEIRTVPANVTVKVNGRDAGRTGNDGKLTVHKVQVAIPQTLEFRKEGHEDESIILSIPAAYQGKIFKRDEIRLSRRPGAPERGRGTAQSIETPSRGSSELSTGSRGEGIPEQRPFSSPPAGRESERSGL